MATGKAQKSESEAMALMDDAPATTGHLGKAEKPVARFAAPKMREQLTAVFIKEAKGGYCGYVEELPGAITQGETIEETKDNLIEVVQLFMQCHRELSDKDIAEENLDVIKQPLGKLEVSQ